MDFQISIVEFQYIDRNKDKSIPLVFVVDTDEYGTKDKKILSEPKNSLTKQYTALIKSEDVEIIFNKDALEEISNKAFIINSEIENIGARRLHTVMSKLLNEILFDIPEKIGPNAKVVITKKMVQEKLDSITQNKDLSEYIL